MINRPLFVPLRTEWFEAFRVGRKSVEWRVYGPRWNHRVVRPGRAVVLSHGYSGARLYGRVVHARRVAADRAPNAARRIYPGVSYFCAIHVRLGVASDGIPKKRAAVSRSGIAGPA